jgi:acetaldehyde dehydrogenase (acetylating)
MQTNFIRGNTMVDYKEMVAFIGDSIGCGCRGCTDEFLSETGHTVEGFYNLSDEEANLIFDAWGNRSEYN